MRPRRDGEVLATRRIPEGLEGVARLHALVGEHADEPDEVVVGIETDRGLLVSALVAAGYHGPCGQPARGVPLPRAPHHEPGQVRPR